MASHGTLQDADALRVLVENRIEVLSLPQRILLEPRLEVLVEDWDERHRLLTRSLAQREEERDILRSKQDRRRIGVFRKEAVKESSRLLVQHGIGLDHRKLATTRLDAGEPLLNSAEPVAHESLEGSVDPPSLMGDEEESDHAAGDFLVGQLGNRSSDAAFKVGGEPGLLEVGIEALDDVVPVLGQPCQALLLVEAEELFVELRPELDAAGCNLVDGLAEF